MNAISENVENGTIRVDSATQQASAIDVVRVVQQCNSSVASAYLRKLKENFPDVGSNVSRARINGEGKDTPVADAKTLVEIIFLLSGKTASEFRRQSAAKVCRLLGGDSTFVSEIEQLRAALESNTTKRPTPTEIETHQGMPMGFRYLDTTDRQAVAKQVVKHELERQQQALKRQRCDDMFGKYQGLVNLKVELDDRTKIELRNNVSILTRQDLAIEYGGAGHSTGCDFDPAPEDTEIHTRAW